MYIKTIVTYLFLFICFECFAQKKSDFIICANTIQKIIYIHPSLEQIDNVKKEYYSEEDFYIAADDASYYFYLANDYLNKNKIYYETLVSDKDIYIYLKKKKEEKSIFQRDIGFGIFFIYEKDKYREFVNCIDIGIKWKYTNGHWEKQ